MGNLMMYNDDDGIGVETYMEAALQIFIYLFTIFFCSL